MINGGSPDIPGGTHSVIRQLCERCFERDVKYRLSSQELLMFLRTEIRYRVKGQAAEPPTPYFEYKSAVEDEDEDEDEPSRGEYCHNAYLGWAEPIGRGGFADVYSIKITNNNDPSAITFKYGKDLLALKVLRNSRLNNEKRVVLRSLDHSNVVKYVAFGRLPIALIFSLPSLNPQTAILMEYYAGGNLNTYSSNGDHTENELMQILQQVADGLQYLHTHLFHGDLKGENIFLTADQKHCKIGDLENHHLLVDKKTITGGFRAKQGTLRHMSPEMLHYTFGDDPPPKTDIGRASDIWSFGCTVLELFDKGKVEYKTKDGTDNFLRAVINGGSPHIPGGTHPVIRQFCEGCFERDVKDRLSSHVLLQILRTEIKNRAKGQAAEPPIPYFLYVDAIENEPGSEDYHKAYLNWASFIGCGGFADVYSIEITNNKDPSAITFKYGKDLLALKVLKNSRLNNHTWIFFRSLDHSNIVKYVTFGQLPIAPNALLPSLNPQTAILMEYYGGGNLNTYSSNGYHTENELMQILQQVADGLRYLHGYGRIASKTPLFHGDLKGENIFLTADQKHCKIGDLENHHLLVHEKTVTGGFRANQGTLRHMSPEMLQYTFGDDSSSATGIGRASNIWSFGCTVLELFDKGKVEYRTVDGTVIPLECPAPAQLPTAVVVHQAKPDKQFARFVADGAYPDLSTPGGGPPRATGMGVFVGGTNELNRSSCADAEVSP
ncbi:putative Cytokinesis protein sepH [Hypsibius exemplaris]|uniref:Cytokinesis protein sepH n=1 Tax=Hypsibius exemplaris TaxID=2072580 RepID=A0A1W0WDV4_HYPEX|nr:putative Cytokinesis protein sepH [Hypsibius exemplaris]